MAILLLLACAGLLDLAMAQSTFYVMPAYLSGLPNKAWNITSANSKNFKSIQTGYKNAKKSGDLLSNGSMPSQLGYRGCYISIDKKTLFVIVGNNTMQLQLDIVNDGLARQLLTQNNSDSMLAAIRSGAAQPPTESVLQKRVAYPGALDLWRTWLVQYCNNCYNYGTNKRCQAGRRFGQPGIGGGVAMNNPMTGAGVRASAESDGLTFYNGLANGTISKNATHLVALVVDPGVDFHWYRRDNNGFWSHKPGSTAVTNLDGNNAVINDPTLAANALLGPNYQFVAFMEANYNTNLVQGVQNPNNFVFPC